MRVQLDDITLTVEDHGAGSPVVLRHGWPDTARLWRHQVPALLSFTRASPLPGDVTPIRRYHSVEPPATPYRGSHRIRGRSQ